MHSFCWLDDLAAAGDAPARACARLWLSQWLDRFGTGKGPGWDPDITGKRLIRWIMHVRFLTSGEPEESVARYLASLAQQTRFLEARWPATERGLARIEALVGLIHASVVLDNAVAAPDVIATALGRECRRTIDESGGIADRNPEHLLDIFTLLNWAAMIMRQADQSPTDDHLSAIARVAPVLRALRHADGGLARFHGGGRGVEGRLDAALADSRIAARRAEGLAMGFARLSAGRTSLIIDAAVPPTGRASHNAHASTLAFEMTSGRRPVIVNCGSGVNFGPDWRRAGRATPSHSTLVLNGQSSGQLGQAGASDTRLTKTPINVPVQLRRLADGVTFESGHDGYKADFGLTHARTLEMTSDGSGLAGKDALLAIDASDRKTFDRALRTFGAQGIPLDVRFHLHPDIDASLDMGGQAVSLALKSGEIWIFRFDNTARLAVEPSVYLEKTRLTPRSSKQIVLSGRAVGYATRIRWSLSKPQDSPVGIRDVAASGQTPVAIS